MANRSFGERGVDIEAGDHICAFFRGGHERDSLLFSFLEHGLRTGDKCFCIVDTLVPDDVVATLADRVEVRARALEVLRSGETYGSPDSFSPDALIALLSANVHRALDDDGFGFVRTVGEMTTTFTNSASRGNLLAYEVAVTEFVPTLPQVALCLYDLERFDGATIIDMIRAHPKVLVDGVIIENPFHLRPQDLVHASGRPRE